MTHAKFAPSGAERWIKCPGSIRLTADVEDEGSKYAAEGSTAHELAQCVLTSKKDVYAVEGTYNDEMRHYIDEYVTFVQAQKYNEMRIETVVNLDHLIPECFGTVDCLQVDENTLRIIDLKYGKGVQVEAEQNYQLMLYALGALHQFDLIYDIKEVELIIFQPRRDHISRWTTTPVELNDFGRLAAEAAKLAESPDSPLNPGKTQCQWCLIKSTCKARKDKIMSEEFPSLDLLQLDEIAVILPKIDEIIAWCKDIKEHALKCALQGLSVPGYKLVAGRSVRKWTALAESELLKLLPEGQIYKKSLQGIPAIEKLLGKKHEIFSQITEKPSGAPVLVPDSDKRQPVNTAKTDFEEK